MVTVTKRRPLSVICGLTGGLPTAQCQSLFLSRTCLRLFSLTSGPLNRSYYEVLGLDSDASSSDIKNAYYKLSKKYHPDVCDDQESIRKFHEVSQAYDVLGDPRKRRKYDKGNDSFGANREDDERVKYRYEGEDFMKNRAGLKETYSGEGAYCNIRSRRTGDRNRHMDDLLISSRRRSFQDKKSDFDIQKELAEKHNLTQRRASVGGRGGGGASRPPYSGSQGGGGGGGGFPGGLLVLIVVLYAMFKMAG